jgi:hypothetical protein
VAANLNCCLEDASARETERVKKLLGHPARRSNRSGDFDWCNYGALYIAFVTSDNAKLKKALDAAQQIPASKSQTRLKVV